MEKPLAWLGLGREGCAAVSSAGSWQEAAFCFRKRSCCFAFPVFRVCGMAFESWSGHSSIEITGPLRYKGKSLLNPCYSCFSPSSCLIFHFVRTLWSFPQASPAEIRADESTGSPGLTLGSACRYLCLETANLRALFLLG